MSDGKRKPKSQDAGEVTSLFRILMFMSCDPNVSEAEFRIAFRISQARNADTGWAEIGDAQLLDEMPRTDKSKLRRFRRRMEELRWLETVEGERGRATLYFLRDDNVPAIEERVKQAKGRRQEKFILDQIQYKTALQAASLGIRIHPSTGEVLGNLREQISPLKRRSKGRRSPPDRGAISPPLLPQSSTSQIPLPAQEMTKESSASRLLETPR